MRLHVELHFHSIVEIRKGILRALLHECIVGPLVTNILVSDHFEGCVEEVYPTLSLSSSEQRGESMYSTDLRMHTDDPPIYIALLSGAGVFTVSKCR